MNKKRGLKNLIIVVSFVTFMVAYATYSNYKPSKNIVPQPSTVQEIQQPLISKCGLTIQNLFDGDKVKNRFNINAVLTHNTTADKCQWVAFEAQVGVVYVKDPVGNTISAPALMTTNQVWMTTDPVLYTAEINILEGYKGPAVITIDEENASDEQISKEITFSVLIE